MSGLFYFVLLFNVGHNTKVTDISLHISKCFRNKTFTLALRSGVFLFFCSFCCAGFTLSKKHCSKLLFESVSLLQPFDVKENVATLEPNGILMVPQIYGPIVV